MYPARELSELSRQKAELRVRIAARRLDCYALAVQAARPIALLDRIVAQWRRISPFAKFAAIPLGFLLQRKARTATGNGWWGKLVRFGPLVASALKMAGRRRF